MPCLVYFFLNFLGKKSKPLSEVFAGEVMVKSIRFVRKGGGFVRDRSFVVVWVLEISNFSI